LLLQLQEQYCIINKKGVDFVNKNITFSLDEKIIKELKEVSDKTMISQSKIVKLGIELAIKQVSQK
jgi:hypothetical protein